jgi:drug/metabolite transporter (DMT)-like permease
MDIITSLLMLTVLVGWGSWSFLQNLATKNMHPMRVQILYVIFSLLFTVITLFFHRPTVESMKTAWPTREIIFVLAAAAFVTVGNVSFLIASKRVDANMVIGISSAYPVISLVLNLLVLHDKPTALRALGMILVICGIIMLGLK